MVRKRGTSAKSELSDAALCRRAGFEIDVVRTVRECPDYFGLILVD